jgi:hypothetical protein
VCMLRYVRQSWTSYALYFLEVLPESVDCSRTFFLSTRSTNKQFEVENIIVCTWPVPLSHESHKNDLNLEMLNVKRK